MFQRLFGLLGYVKATPPDTRDVAKTKLVKALSRDKYTWRSVERLTKIAGVSSAQTRVYLHEIGARTSYRDGDVYGLKSRVGESGRRPRRRSSF